MTAGAKRVDRVTSRGTAVRSREAWAAARSVFGHVVMVGLCVLLFAGCTSPGRRSALEIYDEDGNRKKGATDTYEITLVYPYHYDDVFDAAFKSAFRNGFQIEREDRDRGVIQGSTMRQHIFSGGSNIVPFTLSIKVREVSDEPRTELHFVLDTHWGVPYDSLTIMMEPPSQKFGPEILADIQKVLSTFE